MPETFAFYTFAAIAVGASVLVIGQRNPMYSVLLLIASFGALSGLYIQLDAPFVAIAQIIIYAGAIMVLFLFVVMLLNAPREDAAEWDRTHPLRQPGVTRWGTLLAGLLIAPTPRPSARSPSWGDRCSRDTRSRSRRPRF
jgi:NADH-quinone oxidoreductase subunit J